MTTSRRPLLPSVTTSSSFHGVVLLVAVGDDVDNVEVVVESSRTDLCDDVVDLTSLSALDVVEINKR